MKIYLPFLLVFSWFCLPLAGCGGGSKIVGEWDISGLSGMPPGATMSTHFKPDGKMDATLVMKGSDAGFPNDAILTMRFDGTYKLENDELTVNATDVKLDIKNMDENLAKMMKDGFDSSKAETLKSINETTSSKIKWDGDNRFEVSSGDGQKIAFIRKK
jgi:hypothetical protein